MKTKRPGKTIFFSLSPISSKKFIQVAVHLSSDNHWSYQIYEDGVKTTKMQRARIEEIVDLFNSYTDTRALKYNAKFVRSFFVK